MNLQARGLTYKRRKRTVIFVFRDWECKAKEFHIPAKIYFEVFRPLTTFFLFLPFRLVIAVYLILTDMKKLFSFCFAVCLTVVVSAQKVYFLYLQTEDQSPFYVRMADKIHSSSTSGHLILPNLKDSTYTLGLGFAKSTQPETKFAVTINQNDKGYLVKNFAEGLSLFDLQDLSIVKSVSANQDNTVYETKTDRFSSVLSKAADDPSLLKVAVVKKEEPKPKPQEKEVVAEKIEDKKEITQVPKDSAVSVKIAEAIGNKEEKKEEAIKSEITSMTETKATETKTEEPQKQQVKEEVAIPTGNQEVEYKRSKIVRRSESSTTEGFGVIFYDRMENSTDTIRILIPPSKIKFDGEQQNVGQSEIGKDENSPIKITEAEKVANAGQPITANQKTEKSAENIGSSIATSDISNSNCKGNASDKDFMKLRKNMASEETDETMIDQAKKVYKNKCFTVEQLRYLSTLFLTSSAKYQFFDASYKNVSDKQNFKSLQSEIKDEYYLKRFKALVGE